MQIFKKWCIFLSFHDDTLFFSISWDFRVHSGVVNLIFCHTILDVQLSRIVLLRRMCICKGTKNIRFGLQKRRVQHSYKSQFLYSLIFFIRAVTRDAFIYFKRLLADYAIRISDEWWKMIVGFFFLSRVLWKNKRSSHTRTLLKNDII